MRSSWKGRYVSKEVYTLFKKGLLKNSDIYSRSSRILPEFVGLDLRVHNGRTFYPIHISENMVGYTFGEFVFTKSTGTSIHKNQLKKQEAKRR